MSGRHDTQVIVLLADGARPDTLRSAIEAGRLPALARLRAEGGLHTISSVFPSVTGPAYTPFLMGRHPAAVGLPGLRWFDRERAACRRAPFARSYVGPEMRRVDADLDPDAPTIFELTTPALGALSVIGRGLPRAARIGSGARFVVRTAFTHFRGDVRGWLGIDRSISASVVEHIREARPRFSFIALTGVDKTSHAEGHGASVVGDAFRIVDDTAAALRADAERDGRWERTHLWVVSDHGHSRVTAHEDLAGFVAGLGHRVMAHPWVYRRRPQVAVMVSGNAMAHLYVDVASRERQWWTALRRRWEAFAAELMARPSVDLLLLPHDEHSCEIRSRERGTGLVTHRGGRHSYRPLDGDPLGVGPLDRLDATAAHEATMTSDYPDALVQIAHLAGASRSGDIILSAARDWDFRAHYEPIPHVSSHGALHREHMLVPLLTSHPVPGTPRRTVDVMPSALRVLGVEVPREVEGKSFVR